MRKIIWAIGCLLLSLTLLAACSEPTSSNEGASDPPPSISVRSTQELNTMRQMIACEDEAELMQYLSGIEGGGADSREDLKFFVDLIDSVPYVKWIEGDITWISYRISDVAETLYISLETPNGDWTRIEYDLSLRDTEQEIEARLATQEVGERFSTPLRSGDGRILVYHEMRKAHPSGQGELITWLVGIDGMLANIVFYDSVGGVWQPQAQLPATAVIPFG